MQVVPYGDLPNSVSRSTAGLAGFVCRFAGLALRAFAAPGLEGIDVNWLYRAYRSVVEERKQTGKADAETVGGGGMVPMLAVSPIQELFPRLAERDDVHLANRGPAFAGFPSGRHLHFESQALVAFYGGQAGGADDAPPVGVELVMPGSVPVSQGHLASADMNGSTPVGKSRRRVPCLRASDRRVHTPPPASSRGSFRRLAGPRPPRPAQAIHRASTFTLAKQPPIHTWQLLKGRARLHPIPPARPSFS